ncbi:hypothetical protein [Escherichia coli]
MIWQPEFTDKTLSRKPGAVQDIQRTLDNTFPNEHPEAFILIPSAEKFIVDGNCIQLIGIGNEQGEFDFYRQIYPVTGGEHQVEALMWTHLPA